MTAAALARPDAAPPSASASAAPAPPAAFRARRVRLGLVLGALAAADWGVVAAGFAAAAQFGLGAPLLSAPLGAGLALAGVMLALKGGLWAVSAYAPATAEPHAERALGGLALGLIAALMLNAWLAPHAQAAGVMALAAPAAALALAALHIGCAGLIQRWRRSGALAETAVVVGATAAAERLIARAEATRALNVVAVFDDRLSRAPAHVAGAPVVGAIEDLLSWPQLPEIDRIVITVNPAAEARVRALIARLRIVPNRVVVLLDVEGLSPGLAPLEHDPAAPFALVGGAEADGQRALVKRAADLAFGLALAALFAPVMALAAFAIRLDGPGPILFRQRRHGFNNRVITVWKFRTMRPESATAGPLRQVSADDARITRVGRFLRKTSLDELPQLWNVLVGDMSLVGPRPHAVAMKTEDADCAQIVADYAHRHRMKPGLTGWAQINGSRGPLETAEAVRERVRLDLEYIERANFWFDLWIMLRTAPALLGDKTCVR